MTLLRAGGDVVSGFPRAPKPNVNPILRINRAARSLTVFLVALVCTTLASFSQSSGTNTGTITGRVMNAETRQFLNQSVVRIRGTSLLGHTDNEGTYRISNVPAGPQTLVVEYLGLQTEEIPLNIASGSTVRRDVEMKSGAMVLETFVVAGDREGQAAALNQQKNADYMKSVVASDAFGDLLDNNAAELLKSLPGIALNYGGEDAIGFTMRGQNSAYATVTTDGAQMASGASDGVGGRAVNFRNLTVNNIESIEINRAPTAAQPANSLGGSINFVSKSAFSQKGRRIKLDVAAVINTDSVTLGKTYEGVGEYDRTVVPSVQLSFSDTFRDETAHPIGLVGNLIHGGRYLHNTTYNIGYAYAPPLVAGQFVDRSTPALPSVVVLREGSAVWRQRSIGLNADFKLSETTTLLFRGSYQEGPQNYVNAIGHVVNFIAGNQTSGAGSTFAILNGNTPDHVDSRPNATPVAAGTSAGSRISKVSTSEYADNQWYQFTGGTKHRYNKLHLDSLAYYGRAFDRRDPPGTPRIGNLNYDIINIGFVMNGVQDPSRTTVRQTAGDDYMNAANYGRLFFDKDTRFVLDTRAGTKFDAKWQPDRWPVVVQSGFSEEYQRRFTSGRSPGIRYRFGAGPDGAFGTADDVALPVGEFVDMRLPGGGWIHNGPNSTTATGPWLDIAKVWDYAARNPQAVTRDLVNDVLTEMNDKTFEEEIRAGYLMGTARIGKLTFVPGLRWEETIDKGRGWGRVNAPISTALPLEQQAALTRAQHRRFNRKTTYDDFFPNVQAKYAFTPSFQLRGAYTHNLGRPNFAVLLPGDTINPANMTISRNNPDLEPFYAKNYDISAEYYFNKSTGSVTFALFRKDIRNYFTNQSSLVPDGPNNGYDGEYVGYAITQQRNIPGMTRTEGYEIGYQQALRFLPGEFGNVTGSLSYTHLSSSPPPGVYKVAGIQPVVFYGGLTYAAHGFRFDVKYNYRQRYLFAVNSANREETYDASNGRWDMSIDYRFLKRYQFYFNWRNVNDALLYKFSVFDNRRGQTIDAGTLINTGLRIDL